MLFHIEADIDYAALGDRRDGLLRAEWAATERLIADGAAIGDWRKADGSGIIAVWDLPDRVTLDAILSGLPPAPYFARLLVTELREHPLLPAGRLAAEPAAPPEPRNAR
jgi:muconolactone delta-isomerase